ncbi:MAG TPA: Gfo/Idh/MocA family oxidoreductase [Kiritimatiellae bacterium]|nr:Gfo/Idh/MocA family oxidoreductase [Kiritimatiellia bacterium]
MKLAVIGCGLVGRKRALACGDHSVAWVADRDPRRADGLAGCLPGARATSDWRQVLDDPSVEAVIVATPHHLLAPITLAALEADKHVLVEKPGARSSAELEPVLRKAQASGRVVKVGFNHRFHPAVARAKRIVDSGAAGRLMFVRGLYGHGGRIGYEKEWRADPDLAGGGEAIDQGIHLVDLARWILGDFVDAVGYAPTLFWNMPVEDNCFMLLQTESGACAFLHASWTEWKNMFCFEIYGRRAKLRIDGLGGSYGIERLTHYRMLPGMGPPETEVFEYPGPDESWRREIESFVKAIAGDGNICGGLSDALAALRIVERIRKSRNRLG